MQLSKQEGGIGFRDLEKFNDALLAKKAWRLIQHPNTLFERLFKSKYYKDAPLLHAKSQVRQSYGWSSILDGLALLKRVFSLMLGM